MEKCGICAHEFVFFTPEVKPREKNAIEWVRAHITHFSKIIVHTAHEQASYKPNANPRFVLHDM